MTNIILLEDRPADSQVGQAMRCADAALNHLVELRNDPATRADMTNEEADLWRLKNTIEWILLSIKIEGNAQQAAE